jgi:hypothetical protein
VNRSRRLEALECAMGSQSDDPNMCFKCRGPGAFRRAVDYARLRLGAERNLFGADPEACRAKLVELGEEREATSNHCPRCGGLNPWGAPARTRKAEGSINRGQRLEKLEVTVPATPADRGSHCPQCGGITIEEALRDDAVLHDAASDHCRRCEELTLIGVLLVCWPQISWSKPFGCEGAGCAPHSSRHEAEW